MDNVKEVINELGEKVKVNILLNYRIEELNKEYLVYTLNDDGVSDNVDVIISEVYHDDNGYIVKSIPENEAETVLLFYKALKKTMD